MDSNRLERRSYSGTGDRNGEHFSITSNVEATASAGNISLIPNWSGSYATFSARKAITITNSAAAQSDYQVKLSVTYASSMQADFDDLRFSDATGSALNYWIQTKTNSTSAIVWVKIPTLAGTPATTAIYMYYGNSAVSAGSNGVDTFILFDDFNTGVLDSTKWDTVSTGSLYSMSGGELIAGPGTGSSWVQALYAKTAIARADVALETQYRWTSNNASYDALMIGWKDDGNGPSYTNLVYGYYNPGISSCTTSCEADIYEDGSSRGTGSGSWTQNTQYQVRIRMRASGGAYYEQSTDNGENWIVTYTSSYSTESSLHPGYVVYAGTHAFDDFRVRKWLSSEPTSSFASEETLYPASGTLTSNVFDGASGQDWGVLSFTSSGTGTVTVKARSSNVADMSGATAFASCSGITSGAAMSTGGCVTNNQRYLQYQITLGSSGGTTATIADITLNFSPSDNTAPTTNASSVLMFTSSGGTSIPSNGWNKSTGPYFSWTAGADNGGGAGLLGYCLYLGTDSAGDPATSKGVLGTTPVAIPSLSTCQFIVASSSVDLSTSGYLGSALVSGTTYYLNVKAVDIPGNVYSGSSASFHFQHDSTAPTNVAYLTMPSQNFSNVSDMNFAWPTSGGSGSSDSDSGVLGWQYQINSTSGSWQGTTHDSTLDLDYIPATASAYTLVPARDSAAIVSGSNVIYFRAADSAGNTSSSSTYRTGNLLFGGAAPSFGGGDSVTITPSTNIENSFALSWPSASASGSYSVASYYYMINTSPPSTLATLQGNSSTYISNDTALTVSAGALPNVNKGSNTVYVVAIDDATTPNYSPSNYVSGTFTLNSTDPDNVGSLVASDSSIKSSSQWNVTLTWTAPTYQGAGNLTYIIKRSTDNSTFSQVGTTSGLSYVDNTPSSTLYYYKVFTKDGANAQSSGTNAVSITPTGKWTVAPGLNSGPTVSSITTKKATITWGTDRSASSIISYGTSSGNYNSVDASNTDQVTSHTLQLTNLSAGTTYYYKAKWTDEDGNTGSSDEKNFTTTAAPNVKEATARTIGLDSAIIQFTTTNASSIKIYYGKTTGFGGMVETTTGTGESTYSVSLEGLEDGTKYYYKISTFDSDDNEYEGNVYSFTTLPRPKISTVRIQQVVGTAQPTILVSWLTNTEVSSIVTYYPSGNAASARDEVNVSLTKGEHKMIIRALSAQTPYSLIVKGRDKAGNEAVSDVQSVTTATDTRPPAISDVKTEGSSVLTSSGGEQQTQLIVSWNTDELASSQVEFGEGTGNTYSQKTQEDSNLTLNHLVVISGLTPSKVYHLRALQKTRQEIWAAASTL